MFMHEATSQPAIGTIGADGSYSLKMQGSADVLAGAYKISVAPPTEASPDETDLDAYAAMMEGGGDAPSVTIPDKYFSPDTSGLTFDVKEGANTHNIELVDE
jgi:hypothetical protein